MSKDKLVGRRVQVVKYNHTWEPIKPGMVGTISETRASSVYPIRVKFSQGNNEFFELFSTYELRYLNNKPVILP